jgi:hypothetical protein
MTTATDWRRGGRGAFAVLGVVLLSACAGSSTRPNAAGALNVLHREDTLWLGRVTYGLTSGTLAAYQRLGREGYLDSQLRPHDAPLPPAVPSADPESILADVNAQYKAINAMADGADKEL